MKIMKAKEVSYTENIDGQEYFQVMFEGEEDYVLMQRVFEMPSDGRIYFESKDMEDSGQYVIKKAKLHRDRMELKLPGLGGTRWEVRFEIEDEKYGELEGNLRVIFSKPNGLEKETQG